MFFVSLQSLSNRGSTVFIKVVMGGHKEEFHCNQLCDYNNCYQVKLNINLKKKKKRNRTAQ